MAPGSATVRVGNSSQCEIFWPLRGLPLVTSVSPQIPLSQEREGWGEKSKQLSADRNPCPHPTWPGPELNSESLLIAPFSVKLSRAGVNQDPLPLAVY